MRHSTFFGLTAMIGLGVCTWLLTSFVVGVMYPAKSVRAAQVVQAAQDNPARIFEQVKAVPNDPNPLPAQPKGVHAPTSVANFHLHRMSATVRGNVVRVSAAVALFDRRPNVSYVWVLRAYDPQKNIVFERYYDDQVFRINPGLDVDPTFDDAFPLGPGSFRVTLSLYELFPGSGLPRLKADRAAARSQEILRGVQQVRIF